MKTSQIRLETCDFEYSSFEQSRRRRPVPQRKDLLLGWARLSEGIALCWYVYAGWSMPLGPVL